MIDIQDQLPIGSAFDVRARMLLSGTFDLDFARAGSAEKIAWFENFLNLSSHDISLAHCLQKHQTSLNYAKIAYQCTGLHHFDKDWVEDLGAFSVLHPPDTALLDDNKIRGQKFWITQAAVASFFVLKVHDTTGNRRTVLIDNSALIQKIPAMQDPLGMKSAQAHHVVFHDLFVPSTHQIEQGHSDQYSEVLNFYRCAFLTNYLGCIIGLIKDIKTKISVTLLQQSVFKELELSVNMALQAWHSNLSLWIQSEKNTDYWQRYDRQYHFNKKILADTLDFAMRTISSRHLDCLDPLCHKITDAMVYLSHRQSLWAGFDDKNLEKALTLT